MESGISISKILGVIFLLFNAITSTFAHESHTGLHHWEAPSKDPDRIILTFHGDPAKKRAVTWRTDDSVKKAVAQVAEATVNSKFTEQARTVNATTQPLELGDCPRNSQLVVHCHSVIFDDLQPDTTYAYRVGSEGGYWSEWVQFQTAKEFYAPTQFVYFGDAQNDVLSHWSRVIRKAYQTAPNAAFAVHAGDLINTAHHDEEWAEWFKAGGFIHSQWTAIPVAGNHEYQPVARGQSRRLSIQWRPQFTLPVESGLPAKLHETVYTVDYQGIRIIVLDSNPDSPKDEQNTYLRRQLESSSAKWKIVTCHHSIFSPAKGRNFAHGLQYWKPVIETCGVDLVLNGHDHTYARGHVPVRRNGDSIEDSGTVYITSVSGPKQYALSPKQLDSYKKEGYINDKSAEQTQFFQVINIKDNELEYCAYTALGDLYDRCVITKDFTTGKRSISELVTKQTRSP